MEDVSEARSRNMAAVRGRDTGPERIVRKWLWRRGFRYRLNHPRLPGKPDLVLRKYRTCIFVNGCFWHGHDCGAWRPPKTRTAFWQAKIEGNRRRDEQRLHELARMGWHVITLWECELSPARREQTLTALEYTLNHLFLADRRPPARPYDLQDKETGLRAAEGPPSISPRLGGGPNIADGPSNLVR